MERRLLSIRSRLNIRPRRPRPKNAKAHAPRAAEALVTVRDSEIAQRRQDGRSFLIAREMEAAEKRTVPRPNALRAAVEAEAKKLLKRGETLLTEQAAYRCPQQAELNAIRGIVR